MGIAFNWKNLILKNDQVMQMKIQSLNAILLTQIVN